jgi:hypothetical protein
MLAKLGTEATKSGRAPARIRERLMARDRFTVRDMLAIQMDTSSEFLERWRQLLLLDSLPPAATCGQSDRAELRRIVGSELARHARG